MILLKVKELTGNESAIENVIDPNIVGGFVLRVRDIEYDNSIYRRFKNLKRKFDTSDYEARI